MYIFTRHGHRHDARPDRIPRVAVLIVGLFDHESPLVVTPLTVWTQIRPEILVRFQTA